MKVKFIEKTLADIFSFFKWGFFAEKYARKNGLLQKINPKAKIIALFASIIIVNLSHSLTFLSYFYLMVLGLACLSKVDLTFFIKRILVLVPLIGGIVLLPSTLSIIIPGSPIFHITNSLYVTKEGLLLAGLVMMRVLDSISLVILVNLTTPWQQILKSLQVFGIPRIFILILNMCYKYLYLMLKILEETNLALKSRLISKPELSKSHSLISIQMVNFIAKSVNMTDKTYKAMISRGYRADI